MTDPLRAKIEKLRIMRESASRRSGLYADMGKLDDKNDFELALNELYSIVKKLQNHEN